MVKNRLPCICISCTLRRCCALGVRFAIFLISHQPPSRNRQRAPQIVVVVLFPSALFLFFPACRGTSFADGLDGSESSPTSPTSPTRFSRPVSPLPSLFPIRPLCLTISYLCSRLIFCCGSSLYTRSAFYIQPVGQNPCPFFIGGGSGFAFPHVPRT